MEDFISPRNENLHLSEVGQSGFLLNNYARALKDGSKFPDVTLVEYMEEYFLTHDCIGGKNPWNGWADGGNHRTVLHYFVESDLNCQIVSPVDISRESFKKIRREYSDSDKLVGNTDIFFDEDSLLHYLSICCDDPNAKKYMSHLEKELFSIFERTGHIYSHAEGSKAGYKNKISYELFLNLREKASSEWNGYLVV